MRPVTASDALRPLPTGYATLYEKLLLTAEADERIRAVWLSGSLGRGVADAGSDLDVVLAVDDASFAGFVAGWRDWLAKVTPTVLARQLARTSSIWYCLTPDCLRFDVVVERPGTATARQLDHRLLVLDKDGAAARFRVEEAGPQPGPDHAKLAGLTEEFLRQQANFPAAVVARQDWLLGVVGVQNAHLMLYELFIESNQPLPPMGVKQWSAKLSTQQLRVCTQLPVPAPDRDSVVTAMRAAATAFRRAARQIHSEHAIAWPAELETAVLRYQQSALGWTW